MFGNQLEVIGYPEISKYHHPRLLLAQNDFITGLRLGWKFHNHSTWMKRENISFIGNLTISTRYQHHPPLGSHWPKMIPYPVRNLDENFITTLHGWKERKNLGFHSHEGLIGMSNNNNNNNNKNNNNQLEEGRMLVSVNRVCVGGLPLTIHTNLCAWVGHQVHNISCTLTDTPAKLVRGGEGRGLS
jgi:hypothetical protein